MLLVTVIGGVLSFLLSIIGPILAFLAIAIGVVVVVVLLIALIRKIKHSKNEESTSTVDSEESTAQVQEVSIEVTAADAQPLQDDIDLQDDEATVIASDSDSDVVESIIPEIPYKTETIFVPSAAKRFPNQQSSAIFAVIKILITNKEIFT